MSVFRRLVATIAVSASLAATTQLQVALACFAHKPCLNLQGTGRGVSISGRDILVDGTRFFVRGVCYSVSPNLDAAATFCSSGPD
jgi:hypothetical protein